MFKFLQQPHAGKPNKYVKNIYIYIVSWKLAYRIERYLLYLFGIHLWCLYIFTDPISANLPFLGSAWPLNILLISYLLFVLIFGKKFMENREPYSLKTTLIIYNVFQVIYNGAVFCTLCKSELVSSPLPITLM